MKEFIDKLIERLEEKKDNCEHNQKVFENKRSLRLATICEAKAEVYNDSISIVNQLAEEYKEECKFDCDKLLFAYSDLLRRFQQAEESCIWEVSGSIENDIKDLEAECEELLGQFKEMLYSANSSQKSVSGWIPLTKQLPEYGQYVLACMPPKDGINGGHPVVIMEFREDNEPLFYRFVSAWQPLPAPYTEGE